MLDFIVSKEFAKAVEVAGTAGAIWRGDPDDPVAVDLSNGFSGALAPAFPSRAKLRVTTELHGEQRFSNTLTASGPLTSLSGDSRRRWSATWRT